MPVNLPRIPLNRHRRVLGEDRPATLNTADNLITCLRELGEYTVAQALAEDTRARKRQVCKGTPLHPERQQSRQ